MAKFLAGTKRVFRILLGVFLILLGLAALLTPLTPGSWLVLVGLQILGWKLVSKANLKRLFSKVLRRRSEDNTHDTSGTL